MKIEINSRGNGACPLCTLNGDCRIQRLLTENSDRIGGGQDAELEIVIYNCTYFKEKA